MFAVNMRIPTQKPAMAYLLRVLGILLVITFGIRLCFCDVTLNTFNKHVNTHLIQSITQTKSVSAMACCTECNINGRCKSVSYKSSSKECHLSDLCIFNDVGTNGNNSSEWITFAKECSALACNKLLVKGVPDSQLTESSHHCQFFDCSTPDGHSARYGRLNLTGLYTGSWSPHWTNLNQYIQVEFNRVETVAAVMLQGRSLQDTTSTVHQYVTRFKVRTSVNCISFSNSVNESGSEIFVGNSSPEEVVTRYLQELISAKCVRINPVEWISHPSLRFDVLGC